MGERETVGKVVIESKQCVSSTADCSLDLALPIANHPPASTTATATGAGAGAATATATGAPVSGLCPLQCRLGRCHAGPTASTSSPPPLPPTRSCTCFSIKNAWKSPSRINTW